MYFVLHTSESMSGIEIAHQTPRTTHSNRFLVYIYLYMLGRYTRVDYVVTLVYHLSEAQFKLIMSETMAGL